MSVWLKSKNINDFFQKIFEIYNDFLTQKAKISIDYVSEILEINDCVCKLNTEFLIDI